MEEFGIDPVDFDDLCGSREAVDDSDCARGHSGQFRKEPDDGVVCLSIDGRRGDMQFPGVAVLPCESGLFCPGANLKRESCFHP